jgi:hypothetical protein
MIWAHAEIGDWLNFLGVNKEQPGSLFNISQAGPWPDCEYGYILDGRWSLRFNLE